MLTQQELGQRLKNAREAMGFTQQQVADKIDLTRVAVSQIESGLRSVSSFELMRLSRLYGRDMMSFLEDQPIEKDAVAILFRAHPDLIKNGTLINPLQDAVELFREYINLKQLLNMEAERSIPPAYSYGEPGTVWEAIQMGERTAEEERSRLELGIDPIRDMAELVESQGIPVIDLEMEDGISGIFLSSSEGQSCIFINKSHVRQAKARVAFTIAHEYAHILLDRDKISAISKVSNERDLFEVRANAFAAAFLMPEEGVRHMLRTMGKGESSREKLLAYSEQAEPLVGHHRRLASSQELTVYDVVKLYVYFGVSFEAALYRLKNLKCVSEDAFDLLFKRKEEAKKIAQHLHMDQDNRDRPFDHFALNLMGMAIEAYRREEITYAKLIRLTEMVKVDTNTVEQVLHLMGIADNPENVVYSPE